jgi:hypothetical protein
LRCCPLTDLTLIQFLSIQLYELKDGMQRSAAKIERE